METKTIVQTVLSYWWTLPVAFAVLVMLFGGMFTVEEKTTAIVQRFGRFVRTAGPGLNFKIPLIENVADEVSLQLQDAEALTIRTLTADNVMVELTVAIQYQVMPNKVVDAFYKLENPETQIEDFISNAIISHFKKLPLMQVFEQKDVAAQDVKAGLDDYMDEYGYDIVKVLITQIKPDDGVVKSMNEAVAAENKRKAIETNAAGDKTAAIAKAEAEKETMRLVGEGMAAQRAAIANGAKESYEKLREAMPDADPNTVIVLNAFSLWVDMMKEASNHANSQIIFTNAAPGGLQDMMQQLMSTMQMRPSTALAPTNGKAAVAAKT